VETRGAGIVPERQKICSLGSLNIRWPFALSLSSPSRSDSPLLAPSALAPSDLGAEGSKRFGVYQLQRAEEFPVAPQSPAIITSGRLCAGHDESSQRLVIQQAPRCFVQPQSPPAYLTATPNLGAEDLVVSDTYKVVLPFFCAADLGDCLDFRL
jgi:hypothetical protein